MCISDWSSDVCSSDLATYVGVPKSEVVRIRAKARRAPSERIGPSLDGPPKASERPDNSSAIQRTNAAQGSAHILKALERHYAHTAKRMRIPTAFPDRRIRLLKVFLGRGVNVRATLRNKRWE